MMYQRRLADSGVEFSRVMIGTTMFGEIMGSDEARAVLHAAWDRGINTIDTADIYAGGRAEPMIGQLIAGQRQRLTICTKVGYRVGDGPEGHAASAGRRANLMYDPSRDEDEGLSTKHIMRAVEKSLKNLGTDYIDLYQVHRWDPAVPVEETMAALNMLVKEGKVRAIGCSNFTAGQMRETQMVARNNGFARFETVQAPYSLLSHAADKELLPNCKQLEIEVIAYSALAGGALSGAHDAGVIPGTVMAQREVYQQKYLSRKTLEQLNNFALVAEKKKRSRASFAIGAVLAHPAIAAAAVGVQRPDEIDDLVSALDAPVDESSLEALTDIFG